MTPFIVPPHLDLMCIELLSSWKANLSNFLIILKGNDLIWTYINYMGWLGTSSTTYLTHWFTRWLTDSLTDSLTHWLTLWLTDFLMFSASLTHLRSGPWGSTTALIPLFFPLVKKMRSPLLTWQDMLPVTIQIKCVFLFFLFFCHYLIMQFRNVCINVLDDVDNSWLYSPI